MLEKPKFRSYSYKKAANLDVFNRLSSDDKFNMGVVAQILPFRVNEYVVNELIDWGNAQDDPIFRLVFPNPEMLTSEQFSNMADLLIRKAPKEEISVLANKIRNELNPHPGDQLSLNKPYFDGAELQGVQHKYENTVLFFPSAGQTCHSYCSFCFRWPQFIGDIEKFGAKDIDLLCDYLRSHREVSDVLITGGDPLVINTGRLKELLTPLIADKSLEHVTNIRIGTKSLTFWPHRFLFDEDAKELLDLFQRIVDSGKHLTLMAHINHWQEMESPLFVDAVKKLIDVGVAIRSQAPLLAHINDSASVWAKMWSNQVSLGIIPYYMFVERDTGANRYFEVPLSDVYEIYSDAYSRVSGLGRTVRGPCMSSGPGKIEIVGVSEIKGEKVFVLRFIQARESTWAQKTFFAEFDSSAAWITSLKPAFGESKFFFDDKYNSMLAKRTLE